MELNLGYNIYGVFHNLKIANSFIIENEILAIVSETDNRVIELMNKSENIDRFIKSFKDKQNRDYYPAILLMKDIERIKDMIKFEESVAGFRNIFAISALKHNMFIQFSDFFDLHPIRFGADGKLHRFSPAVGGDREPTKSILSSQSPYIFLPTAISSIYNYDYNMFENLNKVWFEYYIKNTMNEIQKHNCELLFRSLEMAYIALRAPYYNLGNIKDYGVSISLWVSAFEILTRKDSNSGKRQVLEYLDDYSWRDEKYLIRTSFKIDRKNQKELNIPQQCYLIINELRNDFIHGNDIIELKYTNLEINNQEEEPDAPYKVNIYNIIYKLYLLYIEKFLLQFEFYKKNFYPDYEEFLNDIDIEKLFILLNKKNLIDNKEKYHEFIEKINEFNYNDELPF
jgi:hypothetical protein